MTLLRGDMGLLDTPVSVDGASAICKYKSRPLSCNVMLSGHAILYDLMRADVCQVASLLEENSLQTRCQPDRRAGHLSRSTRSSTTAMLILEMRHCGMMAWRWKGHTSTRKTGESPTLSSEHVLRTEHVLPRSRTGEHGITCSGIF